jgi:hypothetical protein
MTASAGLKFIPEDGGSRFQSSTGILLKNGKVSPLCVSVLPLFSVTSAVYKNCMDIKTLTGLS